MSDTSERERFEKWAMSQKFPVTAWAMWQVASLERKAEQKRWQDAIYELCKKAVGPKNDHLIDGGGCDSGDPLDFTLSEIGQVIAFLTDQRAEREAEWQAWREKILQKVRFVECEEGVAYTEIAEMLRSGPQPLPEETTHDL